MATPENSIKTNIQLFRDNDDYCNPFFRCVNPPNELQQKFLWLTNDTFSTSKYFGYFIWDNEISDLAPFFSRDYFAENWSAIIGALAIAGTFEAYLLIIKSALGDDTLIVFESPDPSHLIINISEPTGDYTFTAYTENEFKTVIPDQIQYPNTELAFRKSLGDLTINETLKLIDLLNVNGVFVEVFFIS